MDIVDVRGGFIKALVFAVIVSTICCFQGYFCHMRTRGYGAKAVGLATISAVVLSCVMILDCGLRGNFLYYVGLVMETDTPLIEFKNVTKQFGDKTVLDKDQPQDL